MPPISTTGKDRFSKILFWVGILIIPTMLIIQVLVYQPFFGHYEDGLRLRWVSELEFPQALRESFFRAGLSYGYWGAAGISQIWSQIPYEVGDAFGSPSFFIVNSIQVFAAATLFVVAILTYTKMGSWGAALASGLLATFLWPFTLEMAFFPGMDERGLIASAACAFLALRATLRMKNPTLAYTLALLIPFLILLNKSQMVVFGVGLLTAVLISDSRPGKRKLFLLAVILLSILFQFVMALRGGYSSGVRSGSFIGNLLTPYGIVLWGILLIFLIISFYAIVPQGRISILSRLIPELFIPVSMMAAFVVGIGLWGIRNYWLAVFGVMFGSAVAVVVGNLKSVRLQQLATVGLIVVTVGWTLYRIPQVFEPLHGIGAFTQGQIAKDLADEGAVIYTSCVEGSGHFNYYTERKWGVTPEFKPLEGANPGYNFGIPDDGQYVFGDRRLCAAPGEMAEWDVVWASPGDDGFRLYKRPA